MYSAVFQQFSIMPVTVEEIVAEAPAAQVDSERVKKCLELAGMWERIQKLPNKLQSQFGRTIYEDGVEFWFELQQYVLRNQEISLKL